MYVLILSELSWKQTVVKNIWLYFVVENFTVQWQLFFLYPSWWSDVTAIMKSSGVSERYQKTILLFVVTTMEKTTKDKLMQNVKLFLVLVIV